MIDFVLQVGEKPAGMGSVHLRVVKLERERQKISKKLFSVSSPNNKRIVEYAAVHTDSTVNLLSVLGSMENTPRLLPLSYPLTSRLSMRTISYHPL